MSEWAPVDVAGLRAVPTLAPVPNARPQLLYLVRAVVDRGAPPVSVALERPMSFPRKRLSVRVAHYLVHAFPGGPRVFVRVARAGERVGRDGFPGLLYPLLVDVASPTQPTQLVSTTRAGALRAWRSYWSQRALVLERSHAAALGNYALAGDLED